jgi:hypothetical protein
MKRIGGENKSLTALSYWSLIAENHKLRSKSDSSATEIILYLHTNNESHIKTFQFCFFNPFLPQAHFTCVPC